MRIWLKATIPLDVNITEIWDDVKNYHRINLDKENTEYTLYFIGDSVDGLKVLEVLSHCSEVKIEAEIHL